MTMWTIKGRATGPRKTTGTVELITGMGLLWHITSPIVEDIWYGIPTDIPATWIDPDIPSLDSIAVIRYSEDMVYLDRALSGKYGEIEKSISDVVIIDPGDTYTKQIVLQEKGSVQFVSVPLGAEIFLDGADQGVKTPFTVIDIPAGKHTFTLKFAGYNEATGEVEVIGGRVIQVYEVLSLTPTPVEKGIGAGTILGISLLGLGVLGAVIIATREKKPEYTLPGYNGG